MEVGAAAVFDEVPYMKLFLGNYCDMYAMVQPTYKTGGFGFISPKGSPLVPDVSRAILGVEEGERMVDIERKWFNAQDSCEDSSNEVMYGHYSLRLKSFWGLFLIAGAAATFALIWFISDFFYMHRQILMQKDTSVWCKMKEMAKSLDEIDSSSHSLRKNQQQVGKSCHGSENNRIDDALKSIPNTNWPLSPLSCASEKN